MNRLLPALPVTVFLLAVAPAAPVPKGNEPTLYFPTKVGAKWEYRTEGGAPLAAETRVVTAVEDKGGAKVVTVGRREGDAVTPILMVSASEKGLFLVGRRMRAVDPPECWLKLPATPGATWEEDTGGAPFKGAVPAKVTYTVKGVEEVEVPAGKYKAVRVDSAGQASEWFAAGVGRVKAVVVVRRADGKVMEWVTVLTSFTPGKD